MLYIYHSIRADAYNFVIKRYKSSCSDCISNYSHEKTRNVSFFFSIINFAYKKYRLIFTPGAVHRFVTVKR